MLLLVGNQVSYGSTVNQLHGVEVDTSLDAHRVDMDDVGMIQRGRRAGFVPESSRLRLVENRGKR